MANILVIEDDRAVSRSLEIVLTSGNHRVLCVLSGEEGLSEITTFGPDLLITDATLPGIDGIETFLRAKKLRPNLKVFVVSGDEESLAAARTSGADAVLEKPFSSQDFLDTVDLLLNA